MSEGDAPDESEAAREAARQAALAHARALTEAEADEKETRARKRKRRGKIAQVVIGVMFALMMLQRVLESEWFNGDWFSW